MADNGTKNIELPVSVEVTTDEELPSDNPKYIRHSGPPEVTSELTEEIIINEGENIEEFEEIEKEYEEQTEENGEVKTVIKKRMVRVKKHVPTIKDEPPIVEEEEETEEDFEEKEVNENGEVKITAKKRLVKVITTTPVKEKTQDSFIEIEEEYEEEEVDEAGETTVVKKTRMVKVQKEDELFEKVEEGFEEAEEGFKELEEEFEEKELDVNGKTVTVTKKRLIKVSKKRVQDTDAGEDSGDLENKTILAELKAEEDIENGELEDEDIEEEELGEEEEEEDIGGIVPEEGVRKRERKVIKKKEASGSEEDEEMKVQRRKRKAPKKKKSKSEVSIEIEKDNEEADEHSMESSHLVLEEKQIESVSLSSAELRAAEERAAIIQHFEVLSRLRQEHLNLRKKNFFLNNKLVHYFKKQKMDHVFMETKEDTDVEQRYSKKLTQFFESNQEMIEEKLHINSEWESQRSVNEELSEQVKQSYEGWFTHKRELSAKLIDSRTGRTIIHDKAIEDLLTREENLLKQISECRLAQIKLRRRIEAKKRERQMEHMGRDFNLMDYEKLASLKEYCMDKITQRDIEVGEVMQKLKSMDDNLAMVKWNLSQKEEEFERQQKRLREISTDLDEKRANLSKIKATRHKTEKNTAKVKQQSGLLAYPILLKDYEEKAERMKELQDQVEALKMESREAVLRIRKLREIVKKKTVQKNNSTLLSTFTSYQS